MAFGLVLFGTVLALVVVLRPSSDTALAGHEQDCYWDEVLNEPVCDPKPHPTEPPTEAPPTATADICVIVPDVCRTATPVPPTATPVPTATATPVPTATPTPVPTATPTPLPTATPTPTPTATPTPTPAPTATPTATPTPVPALGAPANFSAAGSGTSITLSWDTAADADGYEIEENDAFSCGQGGAGGSGASGNGASGSEEGARGACDNWFHLAFKGAGDTSHTVTGLTHGLTYDYRIRSQRTLAGSTDYSTYSYAGTTVPTATPTATTPPTTDPSATATATATPPLACPSISDRSYQVGASVTLSLPAATGGDGTLTYSVSGLPAGLSSSGSPPVVSGTPATAGDYTVTYQAEDADGDTCEEEFDITITDPTPPPPPPTAPTATPTPESYAEFDDADGGWYWLCQRPFTFMHRAPGPSSGETFQKTAPDGSTHLASLQVYQGWSWALDHHCVGAIAHSQSTPGAAQASVNATTYMSVFQTIGEIEWDGVIPNVNTLEVAHFVLPGTDSPYSSTGVKHCATCEGVGVRTTTLALKASLNEMPIGCYYGHHFFRSGGWSTNLKTTGFFMVSNTGGVTPAEAIVEVMQVLAGQVTRGELSEEPCYNKEDLDG